MLLLLLSSPAAVPCCQVAAGAADQQRVAVRKLVKVHLVVPVAAIAALYCSVP
jgi:hypothetical protein